jgi:hypothetical protein
LRSDDVVEKTVVEESWRAHTLCSVGCVECGRLVLNLAYWATVPDTCKEGGVKDKATVTITCWIIHICSVRVGMLSAVDVCEYELIKLVWTFNVAFITSSHTNKWVW